MIWNKAEWHRVYKNNSKKFFPVTIVFGISETVLEMRNRFFPYYSVDGTVSRRFIAK